MNTTQHSTSQSTLGHKSRVTARQAWMKWETETDAAERAYWYRIWFESNQRAIRYGC